MSNKNEKLIIDLLTKLNENNLLSVESKQKEKDAESVSLDKERFLFEKRKYRDDMYVLLRRDAEERKNDSQGQFDKTILTLSTAFLAFSIAVIKDATFITKNYTWILIISWVLFGLTQLIALWSFWNSAKVFDLQINNIDKKYEGQPEENLCKQDLLTKLLNRSMMIGFIIAIVTTLLYIIINSVKG